MGDSSLPADNAPAGDAFYTPPVPLPAGRPGDPVYQRPLDNPTAALTSGRNWLVLYQSQDVHGNPIATSGIIALPATPPPAAGRRSWISSASPRSRRPTITFR